MNKKPGLNWTNALIRWFEAEARKLPWRETYDPYHVFLSEVMLQQTQVATVLPYYHRFLSRFPTLKELSKATEAEVLTLWAGLGYYSRARNLLKAAKEIVAHHGGQFPLLRETLMEIPGIGPYTAGAILSIAFEQKVPLVDGNVFRVYARFFGIKEPINFSVTQKVIWQKATDIISTVSDPRIFNQALMELGSLVCVKENPRCESCPIANSCVAYSKNLQKVLPVKKINKVKKNLYWAPLVFQKEKKYLLSQNIETRWWKDLWDLPRFEFEEEREMERKIIELSKKDRIRILPRKKHQVTHHTIHLLPILLGEGKRKISPELKAKMKKGTWISREKLKTIGTSSLVSKILQSLGDLEV